MHLYDDYKLSMSNKRLVTGTPAIKVPISRESTFHKSSMGCSPPYKRVRALRLFDSPTTPKTLIEKSVLQTPIPSRCSRLFNLDKPKPSKISPGYHNKLEKPAANINPFTPTGMLITARKRSRSKRSLNGYVFEFITYFIFCIIHTRD